MKSIGITDIIASGTIIRLSATPIIINEPARDSKILPKLGAKAFLLAITLIEPINIIAATIIAPRPISPLENSSASIPPIDVIELLRTFIINAKIIELFIICTIPFICISYNLASIIIFPGCIINVSIAINPVSKPSIIAMAPTPITSSSGSTFISFIITEDIMSNPVASCWNDFTRPIKPEAPTFLALIDEIRANAPRNVIRIPATILSVPASLSLGIAAIMSIDTARSAIALPISFNATALTAVVNEPIAFSTFSKISLRASILSRPFPSLSVSTMKETTIAMTPIIVAIAPAEACCSFAPRDVNIVLIYSIAILSRLITPFIILSKSVPALPKSLPNSLINVRIDFPIPDFAKFSKACIMPSMIGSNIDTIPDIIPAASPSIACPIVFITSIKPEASVSVPDTNLRIYSAAKPTKNLPRPVIYSTTVPSRTDCLNPLIIAAITLATL